MIASRPSAVFAERYWGVLNRLRARAVEVYARRRAYDRAQRPAVLRPFVAFVLLLGAALAVGGFVWVVYGAAHPEPGDTKLPAFVHGIIAVLASMPGLFVFAVAWRADRQVRARLEARRAFGARTAWRTEAERSLRGLVETLQGTVTTDGIEAGCRFLAQHHSECAPSVLWAHLGGEDEWRATLVGNIDGDPLLVQWIDSAPTDLRAWSSPQLVVLVARPMQLPAKDDAPDEGAFRTRAHAVILEETRPHRALADGGMIVGWTPAGAWARHHGPAEGLAQRDRLKEIVEHVAAFCRSVPSPESVPRAPIAPDELEAAPCAQVLDAFLRALRDRDPLAALACAHPLLFDLPREATPAALWKAIDDAGATFPSWRMRDVRTFESTPHTASWRTVADLTDASIGSAEEVEAHLAVEADGGAERNVDVHLERSSSGGWSVRGLAFAGTQIVGEPLYESPS